MTSSAIDEATVREALRRVIDPEVGLNVVDLGLIYAIVVSEQTVRVDMALTSAACPLGPYLVGEVEDAIFQIAPRDLQIHVRLVDDPPWSPERMSDAAREALG